MPKPKYKIPGRFLEAHYPWDQCVADQMARYGNEDTAKRVCGAIKAKYGESGYRTITDPQRREIEQQLGIERRIMEQAPADYKEAAIGTIQKSIDANKGWIWEVTPVVVGRSVRPPGWVYTPDSLKNSVDSFNNVSVYVHDAGPHVPNDQKSIDQVVGVTKNAQFVEDRIVAELHLLPSADWLRQNLLALDAKDALDTYQLSIDGDGAGHLEYIDGEPVPFADSINKLSAIAIVPEAAAGGAINRMIESKDKSASHKSHSPSTTGVGMNLKQKLLLLFSLAYPAFMESKQDVNWMKLNENELWTHLLEADKPQGRLQLPDGMKLQESAIDEKLKSFTSPAKATDPPPSKQDPAKTDKIDATFLEAYDKRMKEMETKLNEQVAVHQKSACATLLSAKLIESKLPGPLQDEVRAQFKEAIFKESDLDAAIARVRTNYAKLIESLPKIPGTTIDVRAGVDALDKKKDALCAMFLEAADGNKPMEAKELKEAFPTIDGKGYRGIKQAYVDITGDVALSGQIDRARFTEAIDATLWANTLTIAMNMRLKRDYTFSSLDQWRLFADVTQFTDFKTIERFQVGYYGEIPTVLKGQPYLPLTSPGDEKATMTPLKKGGLETAAWEDLRNDNLGVFTSIPKRLARAMAFTLHKAAFELIRPGNNPVIYDTVALYDAAHANTATTALGTTSLSNAIKRMLSQTAPGSGEKIGIRGKYLLHPIALRDTAYDITTPAAGKYNNVPDSVQKEEIAPVQIAYWSDDTDWVLVANPVDVRGLEVSFLDGNQTPELFVSDFVSAGSWFTNDVITWKPRFVFAVGIIDYRAFDGNIVAG